MKQTQLKILVTRPEPAAQSLCAAIEAGGNLVYNFPTITITPLSNENLEQQITVLDQFDWLIFISPQAVMMSKDLIKKHWLKLPEQVRVAAVGEGTKKALQQANIKVDIYPKENWNSEGLLALPEFKKIENKKIAIFRGEGGRDHLAKILTERGADITPIITYQRDLPNTSINPVLRLLENNEINLIVCSSSDGIKNLKKLFAKAWLNLQEIPVVVISERMLAVAKELGFKQILLAKNPGNDAILATIQQYKQGIIMTDEQPQIIETKSSSRSVLAILAILLAIIALVGVGAVSFLGVKQLKLLEAQVSGVKTNIPAKDTVSDLQKSLTDTQQTVQTLNETVKTQQQTITDLRTSQQTNKDAWAVAEAHYLTKLANDYLQIGDNLPLVIKLLQTADQNISLLTDPNVAPIRKALAADITALQAVPVVDISGTYMRLSALDDEIDKLPILNNRPEAMQTATTNSVSGPWWKRGWHESMQTLKQLVVIRYNKPGERPFVTPDQQIFLCQNMHAMIEQAMLALLNKQPEVYRASLAKAQSWLGRYFIPDAQVTQSILNNLKELQAINIQPELPNITVTLQTFNDYVAATSPASAAVTQPANQ